jgi:hypothetical protein
MKPQSMIILVLSILFSIGGWMVTLQTWSDALQPQNLGGLLMILASLFASALGVTIIRKETK